MIECEINKAQPVTTFLLGILLIALFLRLSLLFWGFPYVDKFSNYFHSDEWPLKAAVYNFPNDIIARTDLRYATGYHYLLGGLSFPLKSIYKVDGSLSFSEKGHLDLIAKLIGVFLSLATVFLVYKFGVLLSKKQYIGLLASALLALNTVSVNNACFITTDTALAFFFTLFVYFVVKVFAFEKKLSDKSVILMGALFGYVVSIKYTGAIAVILFPWIIYPYIKERNWRAVFRIGWLLALSSIVTFFIATPTAIIKFPMLIASIRFEIERLSFMRRPGNFLLFTKSCIKAFNPLVSLLAVIAICYYIGANICEFFNNFTRKHKPSQYSDSILIMPLLALALLFSWYFRNWIMPRYFLMVVPTMVLMIVMFWHLWWQKSPSSAIICLMLVMCFSLQSVTLNWLYHVKDNRRMASKYLFDNNFKGTIVNHGSNQFRPSLALIESNLSNSIKPDYLIVSSPNFNLLPELIDDAYEEPSGPKYVTKYYVQYPRKKERYDLLYEAIVEQKSYTLVKRFKIDKSWVRRLLVMTLWEPEIRIYQLVSM